MSDSVTALMRDMRRTRKQGPEAVTRAQRARLAAMVTFARDRSPYYRKLYEGLPSLVDHPAVLPVTNKQALMSHFDDWVTDREVTGDEVRAFVADPALIGKPLRGSYLVATSSGTSGNRGIFLHDKQNTAVTTAVMLRMLRSWLPTRDLIRIAARGGRMATLLATGGHFAGIAGATRMRDTSRLRSRTTSIVPVHAPLAEQVAELNRIQPAVLTGYASALLLLAGEQQEGRLNIAPVLVSPSSEGLAPRDYQRLAEAFRAKVRTSYVSTECLFLAAGCAHGWQHVNSDWVVLEPVDAAHRPVPPGELSYTVLVSNLANQIQPILRYDLGDGVMARPDPCPCGNPLPAVRVQGRAADTLTFPTDQGDPVSIPPLAFGTVLDRAPGIGQFQIVQTAPTRLRVHVRPAAGADPRLTRHTVHVEITHMLAEHRLGHVTVEVTEEAPQRAAGGKVRPVIPLPPVKP